MMKDLWQSRGFQLLFGIFGIYGCYWMAGIYQEKLLKMPYSTYNEVEQVYFDSPVTLLYIPTSFAWLIGFAINNLFYTEHTKMPIPNLIACAIVVIISTHTYMLAIYITNFPIVMMVKSCNIISVVFVGVFCSRVKDKSLQLGVKKIIIACIITSGILLYNFGGDQKHQNKATDILGISLLVISLVADGFLPDFQAVIKSQYNPRPLQMFEHINKWVTIISFSYAFLTGQFSKMVNFASQFPAFKFDIILVSVLATVGQIFVYRMIKQFKQHIVPFVITTRKIFTVVLSIFFYNHATSSLQMAAIGLVFIAASYEYLSQIYGGKENKAQHKAVEFSELKGASTSVMEDTFQESSNPNLQEEQKR